MCKKAYLYFVGVTTYAFDGFEKSIKETEKTIDKSRKKIQSFRSKPQAEKTE